MNAIKSIFFAAIIFVAVAGTIKAQVTEADYQVFNYKTSIGEGKAIEKNILLKNEENIVANVVLRDGKAMGMHTEKNAFWVLATAGSGKLIMGENKETVDLKPGILVTVKPGIPHDVKADPELSILVVKFSDGKTEE